MSKILLGWEEQSHRVSLVRSGEKKIKFGFRSFRISVTSVRNLMIPV